MPGYAVTSWLGLAGPAGIPQPVLAKLNAEVVAILKEPDTVERLRKIGGEARPTTSEALPRARRLRHREVDQGRRRRRDRAYLSASVPGADPA